MASIKISKLTVYLILLKQLVSIATCHNYNMELTYVTTIYGIANTMSVKDQVQ